jgi:type 1 fimbria pilin
VNEELLRNKSIQVETKTKTLQQDRITLIECGIDKATPANVTVRKINTQLDTISGKMQTSLHG